LLTDTKSHRRLISLRRGAFRVLFVPDQSTESDKCCWQADEPINGNTYMKLLIVVMVAALMTACASKGRTNLPAIPSACVSVENLGSGPDPAYVKRRATRWLVDEGGFAEDDRRCDATAAFTSLDSANWEVLRRGLLRQKASTVWRAEGLVTIVNKDGSQSLVDDPIAIDGHTTKQAMLDDLAWQIAKRVIERYRPSEAKQRN
jgi:hypothetical protein